MKIVEEINPLVIYLRMALCQSVFVGLVKSCGLSHSWLFSFGTLFSSLIQIGSCTVVILTEPEQAEILDIIKSKERRTKGIEEASTNHINNLDLILKPGAKFGELVSAHQSPRGRARGRQILARQASPTDQRPQTLSRKEPLAGRHKMVSWTIQT